MAVTFTRSPLVTVGQPLSSADVALQADAMNSRLRSGLAEPWRIVYLYASLFRQIRNSNGGGVFPPDLEFFKFYQHLKPENVQWPATGAGDPEGVNVASSIASFIYGNDNNSLLSESENLDRIPLTIPGTSTLPTTPLDHWTLAKHQRGAVDPLNFASAAPALDVSEYFWRFYQGPVSKHGNAFGGYLSGPVAYPCVTEGNTVYGIKMTSLTGLDPVEFPNDCAAGAIYVRDVESAFIVVLADGTIQTFSKSEWIHGPYDNATGIRKTGAHMIDRVLAMFASEHRGSIEQLAATGGRLADAFDFQKFFTRQYLLAPAMGNGDGDAIAPIYPKFAAQLNVARLAGYQFTIGGSVGTTPANAFVVASCFISGTGLVKTSVNLEFTIDGVLSESVTVTADAGVVSEMFVFRKNATAGQAFGVRLGEDVAAGNGSIEIEVAVLADYKPRIFDAYVFLRLSGANDGGVSDGKGTKETSSAIILKDYFENGTITNKYGQTVMPSPVDEINRSGIFETAREMSKVVRVIPREMLLSYSVAGGKSKLKFKRHARGNSFADVFDGIVGVTGVAPVRGWTNEWLMGVDFKASSAFNNNTSEWRPELYADYYSLNNRCIFYAPELGSGGGAGGHFTKLRTHVVGLAKYENIGNKIGESPSSFNYAANSQRSANLNTCATDCENFYKSCRIYEPWPEIESAIAEIEDGIEVVTVTFKTRLRHTEEAAALTTISQKLENQDLDLLKAEPYRTDENGIREYLFIGVDGFNCAAGKTGDQSVNSTQSGGGLFGTCYPDFLFVKLIEKPHEDGNTIQDATDSPVDFMHEVQKEIYLRAICEGFVDGKESIDQNCATGGGLYGFTYENLNYQAHGRTWPTLLSLADRPDGPKGFWPTPNTIMRAERFNQFSKAINLLDRVPLMMPFSVESKTTQSTGSVDAAGLSWGSAAENCQLPWSGGSRALWPSVSMPTLTAAAPSVGAAMFLGDYVDGNAGVAIYNNGCAADASKRYIKTGSTLSVKITIDTKIGKQIEALPPTIRDMVEANGVSALFKLEKSENYQVAKSVSTSAESFLCGASSFWDSRTGYETGFMFTAAGDPEVTECLSLSGATIFNPLDFFTPKGSAWLQGDAGVSSGFCGGGWSTDFRLRLLSGENDMFLQIPLA